MKKLVENKMLYLRNIEPADANESYLSWINDSEVNNYTEARFKRSTLEDIREYVKTQIELVNSVFMAIVLAENDKHIGNIKLHRIDKQHKNAEVSLLIGNKSCWGKGFGSKAIALVTEYGFKQLNLNKLYAKCYENNFGSIKAFIKAGYQEEGRFKKQYLFNGKYIDGVQLGIINDQRGAN
jgi:RimJ/RimL family protein N-acetyltransferase